MGDDGGMEDLYKVMGFDGGGEECIRRMPLSFIFDSCEDLLMKTMVDDFDTDAAVRSAMLRWAYSVVINTITHRKYDARLAQTIRIRRAFAQQEIENSKRRIAAAMGREEPGVGEDTEDGEKSSIDDLERRLAELGMEEKRLRKGPPRWRRRGRERGAYLGQGRG